MSMIFLRGLAEIVDRFDLFLFDQFGVLHDGVNPYRGAVAGLEGVAAAGKATVVISNSGRSGAFNRARLETRGFPNASLPVVVTSGDCLQPWMKAEYPKRSLRLYATGPLDVLGSQFVVVTDLGAADLLVLNSFSDQAPDEDALGRLLDRALGMRLPLVCTNPDETALQGKDSFPAPGHFARDYLRRGGKVTFIGKPYPLIFEMTLARFPLVPKTRVVCIGDSLDHDIRGANTVGINSIWVLNGVHRAEFAEVNTDGRRATAEAIARRAGLAPTFVLDELAW